MSAFQITVVLQAVCDEEDNITNTFPVTHRKNDFSEADGIRKVTAEITFGNEAGY